MGAQSAYIPVILPSRDSSYPGTINQAKLAAL
jgi:hypothetical protein